MRVRCAMTVVLVALAACGSSSGMPSGGATSARCGPSGARTALANGRARVYVSAGHVYGCAGSTKRSYLLGASGRSLREGRANPVVLAGVDAAYGLSRFGVDTGSTQVVVRRLTDGRVLHTAPATSSVAGPESFQVVGALVLKPDGAVAWIGESNSIISRGHQVEVHRFDARGQATLARSAAIAVGSLRLHGSELTWTDGGRRHTATLN